MRALPVELVPLESGLLIKRGWTEFVVSGDGARSRVEAVLRAAQDELTSEEICARFDEAERPAIAAFVEQLVARRILVPTTEIDSVAPARLDGALETFYWQLGLDPRAVEAQVARVRVAIVGVNAISRELMLALRASGMTQLDVVDFELLRSVRLFDDDGALDPRSWPPAAPAPVPYAAWAAEHADGDDYACVVATSEFGGMHVLRQWNEFCVERGRIYLPVVQHESIGYVGPLVVPGEAACYECLRARENSAMDDPAERRLTEPVALATQSVAAVHPSIPSVLGQIAALELVKFLGRVSTRAVGTLIEVNLLEPSITRRRVLKIPRCAVCSPAKQQPAATPYRHEFMHERQ